MPMPHYVNRYQLDGSLQPFAAYGAEMFGFVFNGTPDALTSLVDRYLNRAPANQFRYQPLVPEVLFAFTSTKWMTATNPPFSRCGGAGELELTVWVVVQELNSGTIALFTPYTLLDNPLAVLQGREIYGFPKEMARFPTWEKGQFDVEAYAVGECREDAVGTYQQILSVTQDSPDHPAGGQHPTFTALKDALLTAGLAVANLAPEALLLPKGPIVFLKQLPDAADSRFASYQALVEASIEISTIRWVEYPGTYTITLENFWSHPLITDLGVADGSSSVFSYFVNFDFTLGAGKELWRAQA